MRILVVSFFYPPSRGGIESATATLAEALAGSGHDVVVATATPGPAVHQRHGQGYVTVLRNPGLLAVFFQALRSRAVIHSTISLRLAALVPLLPVRQLLWLHNRTSPGLPRRLFALRCRRAAVSRALAVDWPQPVGLLPAPLDPLFLEPEAGERDREVLFVGRLAAVKGLDVLLRAMAYGSAGLTVVGDGPQRDGLVALAGTLGLDGRVRWLGAQPATAVIAEMHRHRVLAVPSRDETFGLGALEGLACGCRVVASDVGALRETLGDAAVLVPADDPPALAEALCATLALAVPQPPVVPADFSPAAVACRALALLQ